jgi:hypothetical protein
MAMRRQDVADAQAIEFLEDSRRIVGGIDQQGFFALVVA